MLLIIIGQLLWPTLCYRTAVRSNYFMQHMAVGDQVKHLDLHNRGSTVIGCSKHMIILIYAVYDIILQIA